MAFDSNNNCAYYILRKNQTLAKINLSSLSSNSTNFAIPTQIQDLNMSKYNDITPVQMTSNGNKIILYTYNSSMAPIGYNIMYN
jgi:hypothetical protein